MRLGPAVESLAVDEQLLWNQTSGTKGILEPHEEGQLLYFLRMKDSSQKLDLSIVAFQMKVFRVDCVIYFKLTYYSNTQKLSSLVLLIQFAEERILKKYKLKAMKAVFTNV